MDQDLDLDPHSDRDHTKNPIDCFFSKGVYVRLLKIFMKASCIIFKYDTIRYDSVHLTCSKMLTVSQFSPPHGTNKKLKCELKIN